MDVNKFLDESTGMEITHSYSGIRRRAGCFTTINPNASKFKEPRRLAARLYKASVANIVAYACYGEIHANYKNGQPFILEIDRINADSLIIACAVLNLDTEIKPRARDIKVNAQVFKDCYTAAENILCVLIGRDRWIERCAKFIKNYPKYTAASHRIVPHAKEIAAVTAEKTPPVDSSRDQLIAVTAQRVQLETAEKQLREYVQMDKDRALEMQAAKDRVLEMQAATAAKREARRAAVAHVAEQFKGKRALVARGEIVRRACMHYDRKITKFADEVMVAVAAMQPTPSADDSICAICFDRPRDTFAVACLHFVCCEECSAQLGGKCPICRAETVFKKLFTSC
jgi:hypothetical protein